MKLGVKLIHPGAKLPTYATPGSACFDLYAVTDTPREIYQGTSVTISTGLIFNIPEGYAMLICSRSGHGFKYDVRLANSVGIIDSDYRGEIKIKLTRDESPGSWLNEFRINKGDRIAQAMLIPIPRVQLEEVDEIESTVRGDKGFGSTGA